MPNDAVTDPSDEPPSSDNLRLELDIASKGWDVFGDVRALLNRVAKATLKHLELGDIPIEVSIKLTDNEESQATNKVFRGKDKPTNVLSFPSHEKADLADMITVSLAGGFPFLIGDIMMADEVILAEAKEQGKLPEHHLSHLLVHGLLHLLGHDHIIDEEAEIMEALERAILEILGIADPYLIMDEA